MDFRKVRKVFTINKELKKLDDQIIRKIKANREYSNYLKKLLEDTINQYYKIVSTLDLL
jgi:hypothetical protein